jgi:hypothetical protein
MKNYFTNEQVLKAAFEVGANADGWQPLTLSVKQVHDLMNRAVSEAIGEPIHEINYGSIACPDWQVIQEKDYAEEVFHPVRKIYIVGDLQDFESPHDATPNLKAV